MTRTARFQMLIFIVCMLLTIEKLHAQEFKVVLPGPREYPGDSRLFHNWQSWFGDWDLRENIADGAYVVYWDSTMTVQYLTGSIASGKRTGTWTYYHLNGIQSRSVHYNHSVIYDSVIEFNYAGDTLDIDYYENGQPTHGIHWDDYYGLKNSRNFPAYTWVSYDNISVSTYYDQAGRITEVDSHNYNTNQRRDRFYTEEGDLSSEYQDDMTRGHNSNTVFYPQSKDPIHRKDVSLQLGRTEDWKMLDSLPFYPNLRFISIYWQTKHEISRDSIELLSKKLEVLSSAVQLETMVIRISGEIPLAVYTIHSLRTLEISSTHGVNRRISALSKLEELEFSYGGHLAKDTFTHIPRSIRRLHHLRSLKFTGYFMRNPDKELAVLAHLPELEVLSFHYCSLHRFPNSIAKIYSLKVLYLLGGDGGFGMTDIAFLPESFFAMKNLRCVYVPIRVPDSLIHAYRKRLPLCMFEKESLCFSGDTKITMADGTMKLISEIEAGEIVLAFDFKTNRVDSSRVTHTMIHRGEEITLLNIKSPGSCGLWVTPNHPIYTGNDCFVPAAMISQSTAIYRADQTGDLNEAMVLRVTPASRTSATVYNFGTTKGNYFANGFLVHNK